MGICLISHKSNRVDDRSYTLAMCGWFLSELRLQNIRNVSRPKIDPKQAFRIRPPKKVTRFS